ERDGLFYVGIERVQKIVRFDYRRDGFQARGQAVAVPADFATLSSNKGLECLAAAPKQSPLGGRLIVVTERSLDAAGNLRAYALDGKTAGDVVDNRALRFSIKRSDEFEASDCAMLPGGDLLLLERRYSPARGVGMRMRRVPLTAIKDGATVDGAILIDVDLAYQIDNMEGMAIHRNAAGETVITLVSDDNFSVIQRNLLLQFVLVGE
ncbi:MAG: esterase-like activity of phytase family protein, partial [Pseudolabrys sp.]|nr:esterase-like activity of phytase family protein [Pseudolabrys sp.]